MRLSKHFTAEEFACSCGCGFGLEIDDVAPELVCALEVLRLMCDGRPVRVNSGCRCPKHNRAIGGVRNSQHLRGTAADIRIDGVAPDVVASQAETIDAFGGIGRYDTFTHLDVRERRARWDRRGR
jgi:uncharacterized protein YcbK (DUF882 family)